MLAGVVRDPRASTDFGNVSVRVPGIHPMIAVSDPDVALHTREFADVAGGPRGTRPRSTVRRARLTALDYLADPALRASGRTSRRRRRPGRGGVLLELGAHGRTDEHDAVAR